MSKEAKWAARVAEWKSSGLSAARYCEERDFAASTLYWWSRRLKHDASEADAGKGIRMARVVRTQSVAKPVVVAVGSARIEVSHDTDRQTLAFVLETLAAVAQGGRR